MIIIYLQIVYSPPLIYSYARPIESLLLSSTLFGCTYQSNTGWEFVHTHFQIQENRHAHTPHFSDTLFD